MSIESSKSVDECPRLEIAEYLDGELAPSGELQLELHFAECETCRLELNDQKRLLFALEGELDDGFGIELPADFARVVATNAESRVEGLRSSGERGRAFVVCLMLGMLIVFGLGADSAAGFGVISSAGERLFAVASFFGHVVLDLSVAVSVIIRSVCFQSVHKSAISIGILIAASSISVLFVSRFLRQNR